MKIWTHKQIYLYVWKLTKKEHIFRRFGHLEVWKCEAITLLNVETRSMSIKHMNMWNIETMNNYVLTISNKWFLLFNFVFFSNFETNTRTFWCSEHLFCFKLKYTIHAINKKWEQLKFWNIEHLNNWKREHSTVWNFEHLKVWNNTYTFELM